MEVTPIVEQDTVLETANKQKFARERHYDIVARHASYDEIKKEIKLKKELNLPTPVVYHHNFFGLAGI